MSHEAVSWVLNVSPTKGTEKLLLVGIASHADQRGENAWPGIDTLARYCGVDRRNVQRAIRKLADDGRLIVEDQAGGSRDQRGDRRPNRYTIVGAGAWFDGMASPSPRDVDGVAAPHERGGAGARNGVAPPPPEQSLEPSEEPSLDLRVPTRSDMLAASFEDWWSAYPRKTAKGGARKAWPAAVAKVAGDTDRLCEAAARFAADPNRDERFTPHASTWLNAERWDDPPLPPRNGRPTSRTGPLMRTTADEDAAERARPTGLIDKSEL